MSAQTVREKALDEAAALLEEMATETEKQARACVPGSAHRERGLHAAGVIRLAAQRVAGMKQ